ncbi:MAG: hypothetical protein LBR73_07025 [Oscillospiraceae bacterium]|jgi:hypothetical protein|nr:hypothetical protein [Oscillospiraceae bacterium]
MDRKPYRTRIIALFSAALLLLPAVTLTAAAEGLYTPYSTQDSYTVDGQVYYDINGTAARDISVPTEFFHDVLTSSPNGTDTIADLWLELGKRVDLSQTTTNASLLDALADNKFVGLLPTALLSEQSQWITAFALIRTYPLFTAFETSDLTMASSLKSAGAAIQAAMRRSPWDNNVPANADLNDDSEQPVFYKTAYFYSPYAESQLQNKCGSVAGIGVIFYDFQLAYLNMADKPIPSAIPDSVTDATSFEELQATVNPGFQISTSSNRVYATGASNASGTAADVTQKLSVTSSSTLTNDFSSTHEYSVSSTVGHQALPVNETNPILSALKTAVSIAYASVSEGKLQTQPANSWSKTTSEVFTTTQGSSTSNTESKTVESTIGLTLPPHTEVLLEQSEFNENVTMDYDYPVAVNYKVKVVQFGGQWNSDQGDYKTVHFNTIATFGNNNAGHTNAADNLQKRYANRSNAGYEAYYGGGVDFNNSENPAALHESYYDSLYGSKDFLYSTYPAGVRGFGEIVADISGARPMSSTGGSMSYTVSGTNSSVSNIVPLYPLSEVRVTDATADFEVNAGETMYLSNIGIEGYDSGNVAFYGFNKAKGHWKVLDTAGNVTNDSEIAQVKTDPVSGNDYLEAGDTAGSVYLKYFIDEDVYFYSSNVDSFAKNSDLAKTAVIKVNVRHLPFAGAVNLTGTVIGYPGDAIDLFAADSLTASVNDASGKEIGRPITFEAKELPDKGVSVTAEGTLTFTKIGTYHIRAVSGDLYSDWVEVQCIAAPVLSCLTVSDPNRALQTQLPVGGAAQVDLSNVVVRGYDQYGNIFSDLNGLTWNVSGGEASVNGSTVTVTGAGLFSVTATVGSVTSNALTLKVTSLNELRLSDPAGVLTAQLTSLNPVSLDLSGLTVEGFDQDGNAIACSDSVTWAASGAGASVSGSTLTVAQTGAVRVTAVVGGVISNALTLNVTGAAASVRLVINGTPQAYANDTPIDLANWDAISAVTYDSTRKEIDRPVSYEVQELPSKGVTLTDGQLSFTQAGTFHIRAVSDGVYSPWVAVTVSPDKAVLAGKIGSTTKLYRRQDADYFKNLSQAGITWVCDDNGLFTMDADGHIAFKFAASSLLHGTAVVKALDANGQTVAETAVTVTWTWWDWIFVMLFFGWMYL